MIEHDHFFYMHVCKLVSMMFTTSEVAIYHQTDGSIHDATYNGGTVLFYLWLDPS
jgi:hypothetical protein